MADPDVFQAYITISIAKTKNPPAVNEKRIKEMCEGKAELKAESEEVITFQFSDKEAA